MRCCDRTFLADNLYSPISLDAGAPVWSVEQEELPDALQGFDRECNLIRAIVNIKMIHIAPWQPCLGLMAGARQILPVGGIIYLCGSFKPGGKHTA